MDSGQEMAGPAADFAGGCFSIAGSAEPARPVLFNSPHSGRDYPARFLAMARLSMPAIRRSEDAFVDELFQGAVASGATMLAARFPRAYCDANREAGELDPRLIREPLPGGHRSASPRVAGGLGVVPRLVGEAADIYPGRIGLAEVLGRVDACHRPYHAALAALIAATRRRFGRVLLVDCHSMPGSVRAAGYAFAPDFIVGDRFGRSASPGLAETAIGLLTAMGYRVAHNRPYAGGHITEHYGRPAEGVDALQIEVSRGLYLDETRVEKAAGFAPLKADLDRFCARLIAAVEADDDQARLAAE